MVEIIAAIVGIVFGVGGKYAYDQQRAKQRKHAAANEIERAERKAEDMVRKAKDDADELERERRKELKKVEDRLADRETTLDRKLDELDKRSEKLRGAGNRSGSFCSSNFVLILNFIDALNTYDFLTFNGADQNNTSCITADL